VQIQRFKNKLVGNELFTGIRVNGVYYPDGFTSSITKSAFKVNDDHYRLIDFTESYAEVKALLEVQADIIPTITQVLSASTPTRTLPNQAGQILIISATPYANNAAALVGGLTVGMGYKTVTGELRIVV
jgi:hypothetical protein